MMTFPLSFDYQRQSFDLDTSLSDEQVSVLQSNIQALRDVIVFFTSIPAAKGLGGHTGGAYDIVPEVCIVDAFINADEVYPVLYDEAGHRVAIQYLMAVINDDLPVEKLLHYREYAEVNPLTGHPEQTLTDGIQFSSGRLGHMWNFVNGVAVAHEKPVVMFGSDGSQQEGNDAEAARFAVANDLNVNVIIDDNDVTIAGHPSDYMPGYDVAQTLQGHGLDVTKGQPEDVRQLYQHMREALTTSGPTAVVNERPMATGIEGGEGRKELHDAIDPDLAQQYLRERGHDRAAAYLDEVNADTPSYTYKGSTGDWEKNRKQFGEYVNSIIDGCEDDVLVIDCDLEGSTGLQPIREKNPGVYVKGGVMERNNYSVAAGYGQDGRQAVFGTFSAFSEMVNSEIQMARLNESNVLAHFSHAGVDWMADNTCHFGINVFFTDNGVGDSRLYFPADKLQLRAVLEEVFWNDGLRFVFSTRSPVPCIEDANGNRMYEDYSFTPGEDEIIREGSDGYIISYGAMLYRCLDVVERLRGEDVDVGLINKPTLNVKDKEMLDRVADAPVALVVEAQNARTGLGIRYGTWLLQHGFTGVYDHVGVTKEGHGGVYEQVPHQDLDVESITAKIRDMVDR